MNNYIEFGGAEVNVRERLNGLCVHESVNIGAYGRYVVTHEQSKTMLSNHPSHNEAVNALAVLAVTELNGILIGDMLGCDIVDLSFSWDELRATINRLCSDRIPRPQYREYADGLNDWLHCE